MKAPPIAVLIPTYNRESTLLEAVKRLAAWLVYDGPIDIYIGNDGDPLTLRERLTKAAAWGKMRLFVLDDPAGSLGANLNRLIKAADAPLLFQMDDDHWLTSFLDLNPHAKALLEDANSVGWIRLMGIGAHRYRASLEQLYWLIDWDSPELYITSNRPHLKLARFHEVFGLYPEALKLGETEEGFCHQCKNLAAGNLEADSLRVAVPLDVQTESSWQHVGDSWQGKGY